MDRSGDAEKVVHPKHYSSHPSGIEAWDVCEQLGFNVGNAVKYLFRAGLKEGESQDVDLKKARAYLERGATMRYGFLSVAGRLEIDAIRSMVIRVRDADPESTLGLVLGAWLLAAKVVEFETDTMNGLSKLYDTTTASYWIANRMAMRFMLLSFDLATESKYVP